MTYEEQRKEFISRLKVVMQAKVEAALADIPDDLRHEMITLTGNDPEKLYELADQLRFLVARNIGVGGYLWNKEKNPRRYAKAQRLIEAMMKQAV